MCCKGMARYLLILILFLLAANLAKAGDQVGLKQVVFIRYPIELQQFATVLAEFKKNLAARGFLEGRDVQYIDVLTATADEKSIPQVISAVKHYRQKTDIFITCGWISMNAREILKDTGVPQLFVPVLESVALKMLPSVKTAPGTNISGVYLMYPPEKILRFAKFVLPDIKTYGYVFDSRIPADRIFWDEYRHLSSADRYGIELHFLDIAAGLEKVVGRLRRGEVDAYGGIVGSFKNRRVLARTGVPLITSYTLDIDEDQLRDFVVEDNALAGLFNPFGYCGAEAARMTADIFAGKRTIEQTVPRPAKQIAFVNLQAARKLKLPVSFEVLDAVDLVIK